MKTLIITDSYDATTDILIKYIGQENIFRLNFDLINTTEIHFCNNSLLLKNGERVVTDSEVKKVLWRKPFNIDVDRDKYINEELKYIFREIFNFFALQNKTVLVQPNIERYKGKIIQMTIAEKYFCVPSWEVFLNANPTIQDCVAKSLSTEVIDKNKVLYTTRVNSSYLDNAYPWYLQQEIFALSDVTIVYVNGKTFAFELIRNKDTVDWRKEINRSEQQWEVHIINEDFTNNVILFMNDIGLNYGRLDFLYNESAYYFLEVNPNGQWAWLDIENENGLMKEMVKNISPLTELIA